LSQAVPLDWQGAGEFVSNMASRLIQFFSALWNPPADEAPIDVNPIGESDGPKSASQTTAAEAVEQPTLAPPESMSQISRSNHIGLLTILATSVAGVVAVSRSRTFRRRRVRRNPPA
jgi:hypothetical protein